MRKTIKVDDDNAMDAIRIARWFLASNRGRKSQAMRCGGFNEVVSHAMTTALAYANPNGYTLSTVVINSVRFALRHLGELDSKRNRIRYAKINLNSLVKEHEDASDKIFTYEMRAAIKSVLNKLSYRERVIITQRYFYGMTLEDVGHMFKITRERVRQIEARAIRQLQQPTLAKLLVAFAHDGGCCPTDGIDEAWEKRSSMTLKELVGINNGRH